MKFLAIIYVNVILVSPDHSRVRWPGNWELYLIPMQLPDVIFALNTKLFSIPVRRQSQHFASYLGVCSPHWIANIYRVVFTYQASFHVLYRDSFPNSYTILRNQYHYHLHSTGEETATEVMSLPQSHTLGMVSPLNPGYQAPTAHSPNFFAILFLNAGHSLLLKLFSKAAIFILLFHVTY